MVTDAVKIKSCPFCANPLTMKGEVNPYGRCDTEGCWMERSKIAIPCDDPKQVESWNARAEPAPAPDAVKIEPVGYAHEKYLKKFKNGQHPTIAIWKASNPPFGAEPLYGQNAMDRIKLLELDNAAYKSTVDHLTERAEKLEAKLAEVMKALEPMDTTDRHRDKERNVILNKASTDLESIIKEHDPEIDQLGIRVWDRLELLAQHIEAHTSRRALTGGQEEFPKPKHKDGEEPCGECRLQPDEVCDICGGQQTTGGQEDG